RDAYRLRPAGRSCQGNAPTLTRGRAETYVNGKPTLAVLRRDGIRYLQQPLPPPHAPRARPGARRAEAADGRGRVGEGRGPRRVQVHLGDRAPLPHRVLAPVGERIVPRLRRGA